MLHCWLLPVVDAIGHHNTHVDHVTSAARHRKQALPLTFFTLLYLRVESTHGQLHVEILSAHVSAIRALWGIAASLLSPQQMMLMLKHPDGLALFAQGQKRGDTDSIWLKKMGGGGRQEMHYLIKMESRASQRIVSTCTSAWRLCFPSFGSVWESITWWFVINSPH